MTPRSIRRAAERRARKLARKAEKNSLANIPTLPAAEPSLDEALLSAERGTGASAPSAGISLQQRTANRAWAELPVPAFPYIEPELLEEIEPPAISEAQLLANRANAQLSAGPTSPEGKAKSSLNAVRTGLTGRTVLLGSDDAAQYQRHCAAYEQQLKPVGQRESDLVQSIADTIWRLLRIPALESALYFQGSLEFANAFDEHDADVRPGMIELHTFMKYEKQFRNLHLQEARLARRRERELAELRQLQEERKQKNLQQLDRAMGQYVAATEAGQSFDPRANGFEFSIAEIRRHMFDCSAASFEQYAHRERSASRQAASRASKGTSQAA